MFMDEQTTTYKQQLTNRLKLCSQVAAVFIATFALAVLAGWILDFEPLKKPIWQGGLIHGSVGVTLLLSALSLLLVTRQNLPMRRVGQILGVVISICGVLTLFEGLSGLDLALNHTWCQPQQDSSGLTFPGPLAPNVAFSFIVFGLALTLFDVSRCGRNYPFQYFAIAGMVLSAMALLGHACGAAYLCTIVGCIKMPLASSLVFLTLGTAILLSAPDKGIMEVLVRDTPGGDMSRRFTCFLLPLPLLLWLNTAAIQSGWYEAPLGWTMFAVLLIGFCAVCVSFNARVLDKVDSARKDAEAKLKQVANSLEKQEEDRQARRLRFRNVCLQCNQQFPHDLEICPDDGKALTRLKEDSLVGTVFAGRYEITDLLGSGNMSSVYKAKHNVLGKTFAVKLMHSHLATNTIAVKRFQQEARAVSLLAHPNLIAVHDFGFSTDGEPYLVMDLIEGVSLDTLLVDKGLDQNRALNLCLQICSGMAHAHQKDIIHRDLKPSNIMICKDAEQAEQIKIIDFGLAKGIGSDCNQNLTQSGEVFGSPNYMSPEQCLGDPLDERSDVYALGCIIYECLTGYPPFDGDTIVDTLRMHIADAPPPLPRELSIPGWLEAEISRCLEKDPAARPATAGELYDYLQGKLSLV